MVVACSSFFAVAVARAEPLKRLVVLRGGAAGVEATLRDEIDKLLLQTMSGRGGFASVDASPVPFEDVALAAGCSSRDADCLQRIALTLEADWLLVRELSNEPSGTTYLSLIAHDGPTAKVTRRAVAEVSGEHAHGAPWRIVPLLIERLYPTLAAPPEQVPAVVPDAAPSPPVPLRAPPRDDRRGSTAAMVGWSAVGVSAGALGAGLALSALSRKDARAYEKVDIRAQDDVDRAVALRDRSEQRGQVARGLAIGGVLAGAAGLTALLWPRIRARRAEARTSNLAVIPASAGAGVAITGVFGGALR